jgi:hypothetical protein
MKKNIIIFLIVLAGCFLANAGSKEYHKPSYSPIDFLKDKKPGKKKKNGGEKEKDKTESSEVDISILKSQLDSILSLLNTKVVPYVDGQSASANAAQNAEMKTLNEEIAALKTQLDEAKKNLNEKIELANSCEIKRSQLDNQNKDYNSVFQKQKAQIQAEISALSKQSFTIDLAFITSLEEQLKVTPGVDNAWLNTVIDFKAKRSLLVAANEALNRPYDAKVPEILKKLKDGFSTGQEFAELTKTKEKFVKLLEKYCEKTADLKSLLTDATTLNTLRTQRDKLLESELYNYIGYDYLLQIILKNQSDFNINPLKNVEITCE